MRIADFIPRMKIAALLGVALSAAAAVCVAGAAAQQARVTPRSDAEIRLSYAPIVREAAPAVVNVYVRRRVRQRVSPFFDDPFFRRFFGEGFGIPRERVQNSLGSGVIVSPDGVIVTNHHVVKGGEEDEIKVAFADKREFSARVILADERTDLAVLRIEGGDGPFPYLEFDDSDSLLVGDLVLAIGNPFGVGQTVTSGIVSAMARTHVGVSDYQFFIQTDAAINPGNSGGPLVDMNGKLVGINTAIYSKTGGSHGIGFAIPSNMVRLVVRSAIEGKKVRRPWLGANLQAVTPDIAESLGLDRPAGALVKQIHPASPAARVLATGDVIVGIDGKPVPDPGAFRYHFSTQGIGGEAVVDIVRDARLDKVRIPLVEAPETPPRDETEIGGRNPFTGAVVANLSPALVEELGLESQAAGAIILEIKPGSLAMGTRFLREGDIVVAVNGVGTETVADLRKVLETPASQWRITVNRDGRILNVVFGG